MLVGYARTSTIEQEAGLSGQDRDLKAAGCEEVFSEQVSSAATRPKLAECLKFVRKGDTLIVCKPDRLARSTADLLSIVKGLERKGVGLIVLSMGGQQLDTRTATGKAMLGMFAVIAEFERDLMLERQREGIAKAKRDGKYRGRAPTALRKADQVRALRSQGVSPTVIAKELGICRASVYRIMSDGPLAGARA